GNTYDLRWTSLTPSDDSYEENDDYWSSKWVDPNYYSNLRIVDGDEDWFHIYLNPGDIIDVNIYFSNLEGNLQLELYSPFDSITFKAGSHSDIDDFEFVSYIADISGDWKIRVYHKYGNSSVFYDLDILVNAGDDWMEENDDFWSAKWVDPNYYGGLMIIGNDEDWFRLHLDHGDTINVVIKNFDHNIGNLQLELFHPDNYHVIGSYMSNPTYHEEFISFTVQYPGEWRIRVYQVSGVSDVSYDMDIWLDKIDPTKEDPYEWNDFPNEAFPLQKHEHTWLSNFHGNAKQGTEDWYVIFITPGFQQLFIYVKFNHTEGNIDISVYEVYGWDQHNVNYGFIEGNYSLDNNEQFYYFLNPGYYLIQIHGEFRGNEYDLWWDDLRTDFRSEDNYEDNDDPSSAYDLSYEIAHWDDYGIVGKSLGHINNIGIQYDNDWYKINVGREFLQLRVSILYEYSAGALGIELYDWDLTKLTGNFTMRDDEYLNYILPSNGTYYIRIYGDCSGSPYDLRWELREYYKKMIPGYDTLILLSVIFGVITVITVKQKRSKKNF
ncbi:MAG: hypothetical protein ACFE9M_13875, partial [Promethearchaeota archaeon]